MSIRTQLLSVAVTLACAAPLFASAETDELLVSDRLTNRVLRYSASGTFEGVLLEDSVNLDEPNGLALSPDKTKLYVASRQNSSVVRYDYHGFNATNPTVIVSSGLNVPASVLFARDGSKFYVSNLGAIFDGATVAQFNPDGSSAGADLTGGAPAGRTGLAFTPSGDLLVSSFQTGEILRYNAATSAFETFIGPDQSLLGAGNLVVAGNSVYVAAGFTGAVLKFNATTGAPDPTFTPITNLVFPASLSVSPDGVGLLVGSLGFTDGTGKIDLFSFDGQFMSTFANNSSANPALGFAEPTGMLTVPEPEAPAGQVGDTDGDGDVDIEDLNAVRNHFGSTGAADGSLDGDAVPFNGAVDIEDLNGVRNNFGAAPGGSNAVPEPSSWLLLLTGCAACAAAHRRAN